MDELADFFFVPSDQEFERLARSVAREIAATENEAARNSLLKHLPKRNADAAHRDIELAYKRFYRHVFNARCRDNRQAERIRNRTVAHVMFGVCQLIRRAVITDTEAA